MRRGRALVIKRGWSQNLGFCTFIDQIIIIFKCFLRYGADFIVLVGSQSCRERSLIGSHLDPSLLPSDIRYSLLEIVGISRTHGIFRTNITNKYLAIDARSTFHHVKLLVKLELLEVKVRTGWDVLGISFSFPPSLPLTPFCPFNLFFSSLVYETKT